MDHPVEGHEEDVDLRELIENYLRHWKWFLFGVLLSLGIAILYLRFATYTYSTYTSIVIKDERSGGGASDFSALQDLGAIYGLGGNGVKNEIEIIRSKRLLKKVVEKLGLNVTYHIPGSFSDQEVYTASPFFVEIIDYVPFTSLPETPLRMQLKGNMVFLEFPEGHSVKYPLNDTIQLPFASLRISENARKDVRQLPIDTPIYIRLHEIPSIASGLKDNLQVNLVNKDASVINLKLEFALKSKAEDVLNELISQYNQDAIIDNNTASRNTANFIDERLQIIAGELDSVELDKVHFKMKNGLTDIQSEVELILENTNSYGKQQFETLTQLELVKTMIAYFENNDEGSLLPTNLDGGNESFATLVYAYNEMVIELEELLKRGTLKNPMVLDLKHRKEALGKTILENLNTRRKALEISYADLNSKEKKISHRRIQVPGKEREYRSIERQQNIKEALYLFLLQKREEASISMALTAPKAKVIDYASSSSLPISPKKPVVLGGGVLIGLLIPFLVIYIHDILNNKISSRKALEHSLPDVPILGELPHLESSSAKLIKPHDRSVLAEAFRMVRTNLQYMLGAMETAEQGKVILVTSTTMGEGKSLASANLGISLAETGNKVILIGADLRNPQLGSYIRYNKNRKGLSGYLYDSSLNTEDITCFSGIHENLKLIGSGAIPPNPTELLSGSRMVQLVNELRASYDYVLIDTAPLMLVSDTFLISKYADLTLYMVRSGFSNIDFTSFISDNLKQQKLKRTGLIFNDVSSSHLGYGSKYVYAYGEERESFSKRMLHKLVS